MNSTKLSELAERLPPLTAILAEKARRAAERERIELERNADEIRDRCKTLAGFIAESWHVLEPNTVYKPNWHIYCSSEHLEAVSRREITRLQINQPPATMKSLTASVMWPAWEWGPAHMAHIQYLSATYKFDYAKRDSRKHRDLVTSTWYQTLWPHVSLTRFGDADFANTAMGGRLAMPMLSLTAGRGNRVIIDDPHSVVGAESEADRVKAVENFRNAVQSRLNDPINDAIIVMMHRLHIFDICAEIERLGLDYTKVILPMEYEPKSVHVMPYFTDPRTEVNELLMPDRMPAKELAAIKTTMTAHAYAGQYQQRPTAREGGIFQRENFKIVDAIPAECTVKIRKWDLAATIPEPGTDPDWTVGLKMSKAPNIPRFYIEDVTRFRKSARQVREAIKNTASQDGRGCTILIPQDAGQAGKAQAEEIIGDLAGYKIEAERETGDKATRAEGFSAQVEGGNVYLLRGAWNEPFIDELCNFPQGHDDQVDGASGAFNRLVNGPKPLHISDKALEASKRANGQGNPAGIGFPTHN